MDLSPLIPEVVQHARETFPQECCGLAIVVHGKLKYLKCTNQAKLDEFIISPNEYLEKSKLGEIVGICHSHVKYPVTPSQADLVACESSGLPWLIVNKDNASNIIFPTGYKAPLIGRQFYHGVLDCYSLIIDYYKEVLNIELPDFDREIEWWKKGFDLYEENYEKAGFSRVTELKQHDVILMSVGGTVTNHAAIYVGNGYILQHCSRRLSSKDLYSGYWQNATTKFLRHRDLT